MTDDPGEAAARDLEAARPVVQPYLPPGVDFDDKIDMVYERVNGVTRVVVSLGSAKITTEIPIGAESQGMVLIQGLPILMNEAYEGLEEETS